MEANMPRRRRWNRLGNFLFAPLTMTTLKQPSFEEIQDLVADRERKTQYVSADDHKISPDGVLSYGAAAGARLTRYGFSSYMNILDVPMRFIEEESAFRPDLAARIVNARANNRRGRGLKFVMYDNKVVGIVSEKYAVLSNQGIISVMPDLLERHPMRPSSFSMEGVRMRGRFVDKNVVKVRGDDPHHTGVDFVNSMEGYNAFKTSAYVLRLVCTNGVVSSVKTHIGRIVHRGDTDDIIKRAAACIETSFIASGSMISTIDKAAHYVLSDTSMRDIGRGIAERFSMVLANKSLSNARAEAPVTGVTAFDIANGLTSQAHEQDSMDRAREMESYAFDIMRRAAKAA